MWTIREGQVEARQTQAGAVVSVVRFERGEEVRYDMARIDRQEMIVFYDPVAERDGGIDRELFCRVLLQAARAVAENAHGE